MISNVFVVAVRRCCLGLGNVEWQNASDFPQSLPSLFFHAMILKRHERQRGSTLAAQFDLTSSEIKDRACKEGSQGTFFFLVGDQTFRTMLLKNTILLAQPLQTPKAEPATAARIQN